MTAIVRQIITQNFNVVENLSWRGKKYPKWVTQVKYTLCLKIDNFLEERRMQIFNRNNPNVIKKTTN